MPPTEAHGAETELIFFLIGDKQTNKTAEQGASLSLLQFYYLRGTTGAEGKRTLPCYHERQCFSACSVELGGL